MGSYQIPQICLVFFQKCSAGVDITLKFILYLSNFTKRGICTGGNLAFICIYFLSFQKYDVGVIIASDSGGHDLHNKTIVVKRTTEFEIVENVIGQS